MSENIEYIVNEEGERIKAIIPVEMLNKFLHNKGNEGKYMDKTEIKKYEGTIKLSVDPLDFQKELRNEWQ